MKQIKVQIHTLCVSGYFEETKAYRLMCVKTKRIIKSRDVIFLEGMEEVKGVHHNRPPSNQVEHNG